MPPELGEVFIEHANTKGHLRILKYSIESHYQMLIKIY